MPTEVPAVPRVVATTKPPVIEEEADVESTMPKVCSRVKMAFDPAMGGVMYPVKTSVNVWEALALA
jgi:hypothetical protein